MSRKVSGYLISPEALHERVKELAEEIRRDYTGRSPVFVGVLKGSFIFLADLVRHLGDLDVRIDFLAVSSYGMATESSGEVQILKDVTIPVEGEDVLLVEDIVDTGLTLKYLWDLFQQRHPRSLRICVLLDKKERRVVEVPVHYVGFEIPDRFVVGYGLDWAERYRHLPGIAFVEEEE